MSVVGVIKKFGVGKKVFTSVVSGPASYDPTTGYVVSTGLDSIDAVAVSLRNNPGNKLITYSVSGGDITIRFYTISADTTTGAISATEDAAATDESALTLDIVAIGE